ncbi:RNA-dependent RNA polymerase RDP [Balamuthia mandrillaris]
MRRDDFPSSPSRGRDRSPTHRTTQHLAVPSSSAPAPPYTNPHHNPSSSSSASSSSSSSSSLTSSLISWKRRGERKNSSTTGRMMEAEREEEAEREGLGVGQHPLQPQPQQQSSDDQLWSEVIAQCTHLIQTAERAQHNREGCVSQEDFKSSVSRVQRLNQLLQAVCGNAPVPPAPWAGEQPYNSHTNASFAPAASFPPPPSSSSSSSVSFTSSSSPSSSLSLSSPAALLRRSKRDEAESDSSSYHNQPLSSASSYFVPSSSSPSYSPSSYPVPSSPTTTTSSFSSSYHGIPYLEANRSSTERPKPQTRMYRSFSDADKKYYYPFFIERDQLSSSTSSTASSSVPAAPPMFEYPVSFVPAPIPFPPSASSASVSASSSTASSLHSGRHHSAPEHELMENSSLIAGSDLPSVPSASSAQEAFLHKHSLERICHSCGTRTTPEWRRGPRGPGTLCNACGIKYSKHMRRTKKKMNVQTLLNES